VEIACLGVFGDNMKTVEYKLELKGWKAGVVLAAAIIMILNAVVAVPVMIALAFVH
jgi:hypothetical protein